MIRQPCAAHIDFNPSCSACMVEAHAAVDTRLTASQRAQRLRAATPQTATEATAQLAAEYSAERAQRAHLQSDAPTQGPSLDLLGQLARAERRAERFRLALLEALS